MIENIRYKGPLVSDVSIPGEGKASGMVPAQGNVIQLSRDRWALFFATLDTRGWDSVRSIFYQLRASAPDGPLLKEGLVEPARSGWDPLAEGISLRKSHGSPFAFGVPKGARLNGKPMPNQNVFAVKWSRRTLLERDGRLLTPDLHQDLWPEAEKYIRALYRVEWMQFRLNDAEDDIEIIQPPRQLRQKGCESGEAFSSLGPGCFMNHAMTPPLPQDPACTTWLECDTFDSVPGMVFIHGRVAPVAFEWNPRTGLYEWTRTGSLTGVEGRVIGETSISRRKDSWIIAARCFQGKAATVWYRTDDPFAGLGKPVINESTRSQCPRHSYLCPDGVLRLFLNSRDWSPHNDKRNPLYTVEVDPGTFKYSEPRVVCDTRQEGLPFNTPYLDMSKLCPNQGSRQLIIFRTIDWSISSGSEQAARLVATPEMMEASGIHCAEIQYREDLPDPWQFA